MRLTYGRRKLYRYLLSTCSANIYHLLSFFTWHVTQSSMNACFIQASHQTHIKQMFQCNNFNQSKLVSHQKMTLSQIQCLFIFCFAVDGLVPGDKNPFSKLPILISWFIYLLQFSCRHLLLFLPNCFPVLQQACSFFKTYCCCFCSGMFFSQGLPNFKLSSKNTFLNNNIYNPIHYLLFK